MSALHRFIHRMGSDPQWQFHFHGISTSVWVVGMVATPFLPAFQGGRNFAALMIMEVSLYANAVTHFGAMSAALAAIIANRNNPTEQENTVVYKP